MVLTFTLVGLGVWFVVRIFMEELTAPRWFFMVLAIGLAALGCWWAGESPLWAPVAAAFAHWWHRLDQIVQHVRDWVKVASVTRIKPR